MLNISNYEYKPWKDVFPNGVDLKQLPIYNRHWHEYFQSVDFKSVEEVLTKEIKEGNEVFPYPMLLFNAFNQCAFEDLKVVILGQDPYPKFDIIGKQKIPQAMGLSFSVPVGMKIPSSLQNIFANQLKNNIITSEQPHGNLQFWASQGCLLLNTALTVKCDVVKSHSVCWKPITDKIIKHISTELNNVVFVLWGNDAIEKLKLIDLDKHDVVIASHPSGLSCDKPVKSYPAFNNNNHFEQINSLLIKHDLKPINWKLF